MDKAVELFLSMLKNGFTLEGSFQLFGLFVLFVVLATLGIAITKIAHSLLLGANKRLNVGSTWLRRENNAGKTIAALYLKKSFFKVWLWNSDNGDLIEESTIKFSQSTKHFISSVPEGIDKKNIPSASTFGI